MAELLFDEWQWRAIVRMEELSKDVAVLLECQRKRICGPLFVDGEYFVALEPDGFWADEGEGNFVGPPTPRYSVFEATSGLVLCASTCVQDALAVARERLEFVPAEYLREMRQRMEQETTERLRVEAEDQAAREARAAIARAKAEKKAAPKKIGRRRRAIFDESGGKCHYCRAVLTLDGRWHVEHKMPKALGGTNDPGNLVASCAPCNHAKHDKTDLEFIALRAAQATSSGS